MQAYPNHDVSDWLNRIGLILGFLSFWFAAPEFIGEDRLRKWEGGFARTYSRVSSDTRFKILVVVFGLIVIAIVTSVFGVRYLGDPTSLPKSKKIVAIVTCMVIMAPTTLLIIKIDDILSKLAQDANVRRTALLVGAGLFTVSFLLQLIAAFLLH